MDQGEYDLGDSAATVRTVGRRWGWVVENLPGGPPEAAIAAREAIAEVLEAAGGAGLELDELSDPVWRRLDELAVARGARTKVVDALGVDHPLLIAVTECDRLLSVAARAVAAEIGLHDEGYLQRIHVSDGGTPKAAVASAEIGARGLSGDRQATRAHHGRPFQAVSLYSAELVEALAAEGHPIAPGAAGENLLLAGIDWASLRPGACIVVGGAGAGEPDAPVVLEMSAWVPPCNTVAPCFKDRRFNRIDHDRHPGWGRAYAWVLKGGTVVAGSKVTVLP